ncbi:MAG: hypothetical protein JNK33_00185, partial [Candidatus Doudnabacteria bacterium]|nr:hypothetical protein [Candidatus Doudnabacteria bacterium]
MPKAVFGPDPVKQVKASATYQFTPTAGRIVRGAATSTQALLAAAAEGVNTGSWKGTLTDDNMHWVVMATSGVPSGFDVQLDMAGVNLNGANKFMIETGFDLDSNNMTTSQVPHTYLQICDWVSSSGVDNAADSNCTTGGWRTLNMKRVPVVATSSENSIHYEIYDGYFSNGNNGSYSTPLANFINTSVNNTVTFRYYSNTATNMNIAVDFLRMYAFISPTYMPAAATPMVNGSTTTTPAGLWFVGPTTSNIAYDTDMNSQFIYTVGNNATPDWYIEKRWKSGALDSSVTSVTQSRDARSLAIDSTYMYVAGDDQSPSWRIEKRSLASGAGVAAFGTLDASFGSAGVVTSASGTAMRIATDLNSMYVVGGAANDWRIEKRKLATGTLESTFGTGGVVTGAAASATSTGIYLDSDYMYVIGTDTSGWRIEKRLKTTGALCTGGVCGTDFDSDGIITGEATGTPQSIASDGTNIYIVGNTGGNDWRIEKRSMSTGALDGSFGGGGAISVAAGNVAYSADVVGSNLFIGGENGSDWRVEKRDATTGALVGGFGSSGVLTGTTTTVTAYSLESDGTSLYISGTQAGTDWRYEQVNVSDGLPAFGYGYLLGDVLNVSSPTAGSSDNAYLSATSSATYPIPDFYLKFKNVKTYTGMNSILFRPEISCSATSPDLNYSFSLYNNASSGWESITAPMDCSATDSTPVFSKYTSAGGFANYVNGSNEIWLRMNFASSSINSNLRIDQMYMILGTVNEDTNSSQVTFGSQVAGRVTSNPANPGADRILDMESDSTYLYMAGYDNVGGDDRWRVEKRLKTTGAVDVNFGTNGVVTADLTVNSDQAQAITQDGTYLYVAGYEGTGAANFNWRVEKRNMSDGALVTAFGNSGVATSAPSAGNDIIYDVKVDASALYLTGVDSTNGNQWRIEKRDIVTGSLCDNSPGTECGSAGAFDTDGIYNFNSGANSDIAFDSVILGANLYTVGQDATVSATDFRWRVQAITTAAGAAAAGFGTSGATSTNFSANSDIAYDIETDGTSLFIGGWDGIVSATDLQMRVLKMNASTGASVTAFGGGGSTNYNPANDFDQVTRMRYYNSKLYFTAYQDDDAGIWYTRAVDSTTAASSSPAFNGTTGLALSEDGGDDRPTSLEVDASGVYLAGWGTGPGNNQWIIEKRDPSTGILDSTFGGAGVAGTRTVNYTDLNSRESWNVQAAEESNNFANDYYAFDNDATSDATIEEAKAATLDFTVTLPSGASVVSNFYAANFMAGASGTVRFGLRDYSGFTGTATGGRILIGPAAGATSAMTYDDPMESALLQANGGYNGVLVNPEDNIDTKRNQMTMSFVTTVAAATTTKATMMIDFAMVSIGWVDDSNHPTAT